MITISQAETEEQIAAVKDLIREYTTWAFTLGSETDQAPTFQGLEAELSTLPGVYAPPRGRLLLAVRDGVPAGCIAMKPHSDTTCELKRLYVRPTMRGLTLGRLLVERLLDEAKKAGYSRIELDSHMTMKNAHAIYEAAGFQRVSAPDDFPEAMKALVVFMEMGLS